MRPIPVVFIILTFLLAACQPFTTPYAPQSTATNPLTAPTATLAAIPTVLADALSDLAARLELQPVDLVLLGYQETIWQDACLGLPQAGENCIQALTPGYSASLVTTQGEQLELRVDLTGQETRCAPGAALAARAELALLSNVPEAMVRFLALEPVDWSDACLELPKQNEGCAKVITPGYRVTMEADGKLIIYRTDRAGAIIRAESGTQELLRDILLTWRSTGDLGCRQASFGIPGTLFGTCDGSQVMAPFLSPSRLADLQEFTAIFASFRAQTPAGEIELNGMGNIVATLAQQRMIAEWARLVATESEIGRGEEEWGIALRMDRSGGLPDLCDTVTISVAGEVKVSDCHTGDPFEIAHYRLNSEQLQTVYTWVDTLRPFSETLTGPPYTDALIVRLRLNAVGKGETTQADIQSMVDFCADLIEAAQEN
jgi:hypothetical protein